MSCVCVPAVSVCLSVRLCACLGLAPNLPVASAVRPGDLKTEAEEA